MIKYTATALALKAFSISRPTRGLYRILGNAIGGRDRANSKMPQYYVERVQRTMDLARRHHLLHDGTKLLELGTGWMHWEALTSRLFFELQADLYDVWDNRQLEALKSYLNQLLAKLGTIQGLSPAQLTRASQLVKDISGVSDFDELYQLLGFRYVLDPTGTLESIASDSYDLVVSAGVFEHLPRAGVPSYLNQTFRVLKPGGFAVHSINTTDHLHLYDTSASPKNYLRYSNKKWERWFENEVQYINRLQRCEWMELFERSGFTLIEEESSLCQIDDLPVDMQYRGMDEKSLRTTSWCGVYQKPAQI
jgi:SAM-dependent methyltransferase